MGYVTFFFFFWYLCIYYGPEVLPGEPYLGTTETVNLDNFILP